MSHPRRGAQSPTERARAEAEELALVRAIRAGDPAGWPELITRYQDRLFGVCLRMVGDREKAADLLQDAVVRIMRGFDTYDDRARLSTWMIRVTMNVCLSRLRSEKIRRHPSLDATGRDGQPALDPSDPREPGAGLSVERQERRDLVARALLRIDPESRAILLLRDGQGLDYERIGECLGVPVGTVKSRLFRARLLLRRALEELGAT